MIHAVQLRKAQFLHLFVVVERPAQHVDGANADLAVRAHVPHHDQLAAGQGKGLAVVQRNGVPHFARLRVPLRAHARRVEDVQPADRAQLVGHDQRVGVAFRVPKRFHGLQKTEGRKVVVRCQSHQPFQRMIRLQFIAFVQMQGHAGHGVGNAAHGVDRFVPTHGVVGARAVHGQPPPGKRPFPHAGLVSRLGSVLGLGSKWPHSFASFKSVCADAFTLPPVGGFGCR